MYYNQTSIRLAVITIMLLQSFSLFSSHIVGGEISYVFLQHNNSSDIAEYQVTLNLYRDPSGIAYKQFTDFGIFVEDDNGDWTTYNVIRQVPLERVSEIPRDDDPCKLRSLNDERLQSGSYTFKVELEVGDHNYLIAYQEGYRNFSINNIDGAGNVGSVYDVLITPAALRLGSSSPQFTDLPPIFICAGYELNIDNSASDIDGDEVRYSFCAPTFPGSDLSLPGCCGCPQPKPEFCAPPYQDVAYVAPYDAQNPLGAMTVEINADNGLLTGIPELTGSYVVGVCIEEYRNGVLLSKTKRDFEFNVVACSENLTAKIAADSYLPLENSDVKDSIAYFQSCNDRFFEFTNLSGDLQFIQSYSWQFFDKDSLLLVDESGEMLRDYNYEFPNTGLYEGMMILNDGGSCFDTAFIKVDIVPDINPQIAISFDTCVAGLVYFESIIDYNYSDLSYLWQLGDGTESTDPNFQYSYTERGSYDISLEVTDDFACQDSVQTTLEWYPYELSPPDTLNKIATLCDGDSIFIYNNWISSPGIYLDYIPSDFTGCDSIVERITVSFFDPVPLTVDSKSICSEDNYFFNDQFISTPGLYFDTLANAQLCDSIISLQLSNYIPQMLNIEAMICEGELFEFGNSLLDSAGSYLNTASDINGCDSITQLTLILVEEKIVNIKAGFCDNESYDYNGVAINAAGDYNYFYTAVSGCDSIVQLELESYKTYNEALTATICESGYYQFGDEQVTEAGSYTKTLQTTKGCDSIITLDLEVVLDSKYEYLDTICLGQTYPFGSIDLNRAGIYVDTFINSNGCDSIIILDLTVGQNLTKINVDSALTAKIGTDIVLTPDVRGGELLEKEWSETDIVLGNSLELKYEVREDNWVFFQSTNELYCVALDSVFVRAILEIDLYFPNIISPDGDGINDIFNVGASETLLNSQLSIYDRWGNLIYAGEATEDKQITTGWNGLYNNQPVEQGTYTYILQAEFINGTKKIYGGDVVVVR